MLSRFPATLFAQFNRAETLQRFRTFGTQLNFTSVTPPIGRTDFDGIA